MHLLYYFASAPNNNFSDMEKIDHACTMATFATKVSLVFSDAGINYLSNDRPEPYKKVLLALHYFGIEEIIVITENPDETSNQKLLLSPTFCNRQAYLKLKQSAAMVF